MFTTRNIYYRVRYVFLFNDYDTRDAFHQLTNWASYDVDRFMLKSDYAGPLGDQPGYFNNLESGDE